MALTFSSDGSVLWTGGFSSGVSSWSFPDGRLLKTFWPGDHCFHADINPLAGRAAMVTRSNKLVVVSLDSGAEVLRTDAWQLEKPLLSPGGEFVVLGIEYPYLPPDGFPYSLRVLRLADGGVLEPKWLADERRFVPVGFVGNSDFVALSGPGGTMQSVARFRIGQHLPLWEQNLEVWSVAVSPSGQRLIGIQDRQPVVVDLSDGRIEAEWTSLGTNVDAVAWSPRGDQVAFAMRDRFVEIRNASDGELVRRLGPWPQGGSASGVAWSPDGRFLLVSTLEQLWCWDLSSDDPPRGLYRLTGTGAIASDGPGSRVVVSDSFNGLFAFDGATGEELWHRAAPARFIKDALAVSPGGDRVALGFDDGTCELWRADDGTLETTVRLFGPGSVAGSQDLRIMIMSWSEDGQWFLAANERGLLKVFDASWAVAAQAEITGLVSAGFDPAGDRLIVGLTDKTRRVLSRATLETRFALPPGLSVGWRREGAEWIMLATGDVGSELMFWRWEDGTLLDRRSLPVDPQTAYLSPDGRLLLVKERNGLLTVWEIDTGRCVLRLGGKLAAPLSRVLVHGATGEMTVLRTDRLVMRLPVPWVLQVRRDGGEVWLDPIGLAGRFQLETRTGWDAPWEPWGGAFTGTVRLSADEAACRWIRARWLGAGE
jgi:WD40 repeat protein